jgi:plasmid stabilization system protein ParE
LAQGTQIVWTRQAFELLLQITSQIADFSSLEKANAFHRDLVSHVNVVLATFPESSPLCRFSKLKQAGCRCCPFKKKHIIVYRFDGSHVVIIGVVSAKRHPDAFDELVQ